MHIMKSQCQFSVIIGYYNSNNILDIKFKRLLAKKVRSFLLLFSFVLYLYMYILKTTVTIIGETSYGG